MECKEAEMVGWTVSSLVVAVLLGGPPADPEFVGQKLRPHRTLRTQALDAAERAGDAIYDASSGAWFAAVNGLLVRVEDSGQLVAQADNVQGHDLDVRAAAGVAVSREPDDTIVLHRLGASGSRRVLLRGPNYFNPRLSPDGTMAVVHESRAAGSQFWLVTVGSGSARVLTQGVAAAWHPQGEKVVFARIVHDSRRISASVLYEINVSGGMERPLVTPPGMAPVEPAVSADGMQLAFVDALTGQVHQVPYVTGEEVSHAP
jgi:hypothetical protein